jgi:c(7)-type cytochrome triheme protein
MFFVRKLAAKGGELSMKKLLVFALAAVVTFAMAVSAFAVPSGKTVEFDGKGAGKVVFDGKIHAGKGLKCADCHQSGLFKMKKGADTITMKDINDGKFCGSCHNGTKAFSAKDAANCAKCHMKK